MTDSPDPLVAFLQRLVRARSISGDEKPAIDVWSDFAADHGFAPVMHGRNVWIERRVDDGPSILLNSHLDTVRASESWTRDPWDGALEDGRVHGLGANDAKGCVASQLGAAIRLAQEGWDGNIVVCASCDEETGGEGMEVVARDILPSYDAALIGEPNDFAVAAGQRGLVKGYLHVHGRRAHASRPWQGNNAIHAAARIVNRLEAPHLNVPNDLRRATVQVTMFESGTQSNVLPDAARLTLDARTTPEFDNQAMVDHIRAACAPEGADFEIYSNRFLPVETGRDNPLVQAALEQTNTKQPTVFPSVCDLFWVSHVPALVMGPGKPPRSHQADEFVLADEVLDGVDVYARIARDWNERIRGGSAQRIDQ